MTETLTALERDLLACVERLVTACETSATELRGLEARSTSGIEAQVTGLTACVSELLKSHLLCVATLAELLTEEQNYATPGRAVADELELSEGRREAAERAVEELDYERDSHGHGLEL